MIALRGPSLPHLRSTLAVVALFALLAPTAGLLANNELAAWSPDHGHLGSRAHIATHAHPYDGDRAASTAAPAASDVTYVPADDAGSAPTVALAHEPAPLLAPFAPIASAGPETPRPPQAAADGVPTPPPRA